MKKNISILLVCSSLLLFGCQNQGNHSSEESSTVIAEDGTVVTIVPENQKIYIDEDVFIYGTGLYKITENKADKMNQKDEIKIDGKNYYLLYVFPNADHDSKEDLYYEEY